MSCFCTLFTLTHATRLTCMVLVTQYDDTSWIFNVVALPKHKLLEIIAFSFNVGGDRFAFAVDASNILTDVFHVYPRPNPENSVVNTPLSSHDQFFPHPTQFFIDCYPALCTSNFIWHFASLHFRTASRDERRRSTRLCSDLIYFRAPAFTCSVWQLILGFSSSTTTQYKPPGFIPPLCVFVSPYFPWSMYIFSADRIYSYINFGMLVNFKLLPTIFVGAVGHISLQLADARRI